MPNITTGIYVLTILDQQVINPSVVITSYDVMTKKHAMLLQFKFGIIIFVRSYIIIHFNIIF